MIRSAQPHPSFCSAFLTISACLVSLSTHALMVGLGFHRHWNQCLAVLNQLLSKPGNRISSCAFILWKMNVFPRRFARPQNKFALLLHRSDLDSTATSGFRNTFEWVKSIYRSIWSDFEFLDVGDRGAGCSKLSFASMFEEVIKREREMMVVPQIYLKDWQFF